MTSVAVTPIVHIVDDDDAVRDSLALLLGLRGYATRQYATAEAFLEEIGPDVAGCVLLDLRMPGLSGLEAQTTLAERGIALPVIVITAHGDVASARAMLKKGAVDFLEKPIDDNMLATTIDTAFAVDGERHARVSRQAEARAKLARLTPRERQVLEAVVDGRHNREIAAELGISVRTIEVYKGTIMDKLQVERLPDLIRLALDLGLGTLPR